MFTFGRVSLEGMPEKVLVFIVGTLLLGVGLVLREPVVVWLVLGGLGLFMVQWLVAARKLMNEGLFGGALLLTVLWIGMCLMRVIAGTEAMSRVVS